MTARRHPPEDPVKVLVTMLPDELEAIDDEAQRLGLNRSAFIRLRCLSALPCTTEDMGLKTIPSTIQLPGGVKLEALQLKVTEYAEDGYTPKTFELMPKGTTVEKHGYVVYGSRAEFLNIKK